MNKRLAIVAIEQKQPDGSPLPNRKGNRRQSLQARFDKLWQENPSQFDPQRNCMERERLLRTVELLKKYTPIGNKRVVDLGCGMGILSRLLKDEGAIVDAVDISEMPLNELKEITGITPLQDLVPVTKLEDDRYDIVLSTDLIGYLPKDERRLYFSELSRLVKSDGYVICSTGLDINTEDALQPFVELVETEFHPLEWTLSSHAFLIHLIRLFKTPGDFAKGGKDKEFRSVKTSERKGFNRYWYRLNSSWPLSLLWKLISFGANPIVNLLEQNRTLMLYLEKACRLLKSSGGISHVIFIGQRRPLVIPTREELMAIEPKHKRQVWE